MSAHFSVNTLNFASSTVYVLQRVQGASIKDSVNVLVEGGVDDGELYGSIKHPKGGDQSANLVVSGTTSGVTLKDISLASGAGESLALM